MSTDATPAPPLSPGLADRLKRLERIQQRAEREVERRRERYEDAARTLRDALGEPCPADTVGAIRWAGETVGAAQRVELLARRLSEATRRHNDARDDLARATPVTHHVTITPGTPPTGTPYNGA